MAESDKQNLPPHGLLLLVLSCPMEVMKLLGARANKPNLVNIKEKNDTPLTHKSTQGVGTRASIYNHVLYVS